MASKIKQLQDRKAALLRHANETKALAEKEDRDLTEAEVASIDENIAEIGLSSAEAPEGKATGLCAAIEREERLAAIEKDISKTPGRQVAGPAEQEQATDPNVRKKVIVPANQGSLGSLKAFKTEEAAYLSGQFILASLFRNEKAKLWCKDHGVQMLAASEGINTAGGYLVPTELSSAIIVLREQYGVFRRNCRVMPMGSDTMIVPRRTGGITPYFVGENSAITASDKTWDSITLTAKKLAGLSLYSTELAEDAIISIADDLAQEMAYAFSLKEDQCGFLGDGTSTYGGIVGATVKIDDASHGNAVTTNGVQTGGKLVAAASGTGFGTLVLADFEKLVGMLPQYAIQGGNVKWYVSQAGYAASMQRLMDAGGGNTNETLSTGSRKTFLGYPVEITQVMNSTLGAQASKIVVLLGDLRLAAMMGERRGITVKTSEHYAFNADQLAIMATERVDINVHDMGNGTTPGPLVALETAAT